MAGDDRTPVTLALLAGLTLCAARSRRRPGSPRRSSAAARLALVVYGAGALATTSGCGPSVERPTACPDDMLVACPSPAPGFTADAAPIVRAHCGKCHAPGQPAQGFPFQTYDEIAPLAGDINLQLQLCAMPPAPEAPLSGAERRAMFGWILCGALDD